MTGCVRTALGIDVCQDRVSMALISEDPSGYKIVRAGSISLPQGVVCDGGLVEVKTLSKVLRKLRRRIRIPRMTAAVSMSVAPLVLQVLDLPKQMPANVRHFVEEELRQYVSLSGTDIVSDFCSVGSGAGSQRRILSTAAERDKIQTLIKACAAAGLTVEVIEPVVLAYARAAGRKKTACTHADKELVVEINGHYLAACLLRRGAVDLARVKSLPAGVEEAEPACQWLAEEIRAMTRYYDAGSAGSDAQWQGAVIVRNVPWMTPAALAFLRAETGIDTLAVTDSRGVDLASVEEPPRPSADPPSTVAVGLALKLLDTDNDAWKINLLPGDVTQMRSSRRRIFMASTAAAMIFLAVLVTLHVLSRTTEKMHQDLDHRRLVEKLHTTPALAAEARRLDRQIKQVERDLEQMNGAVSGQRYVDWPSILRVIRESAPADVCITRLWSRETRSLSLKGLSLSYGAAQTFVRGLDERGEFTSVALTKLDRRQDNRVMIEYEIDCLLRTTR